MEGSSRSYSSTSNDYNLTSPKDHFSSPPKKKHSMVLNLGNKSSSVFGADQTPTPTRFIRNCEEVGLFQDLQNVNPFEETFRKAVESGKTGSLALQNSRLSVVTDDTLHTPHVFPHIIENDSVCRPELAQKPPLDRTGSEETAAAAEERVGVVRPAVKVVRQEADTSQLRPIAPSLRSSTVKGSTTTQPVQLILQMPDGRLMQLNATQLDADKKTELQGPVDLVARVDKSKAKMGSVILHTSPEKKQDSDNISPLIKEKLKARLGNSSASVGKASPATDQRVSKSILRDDGVRSKRTSFITNSMSSEDDEEAKRKRFLERNRAAAMRCREKRKFWVATLERRAEQMLSNNQQLQLEVGALRAEVAHLKTLLLAHKDCPVTQAMCNNQVNSGSVVFPVEVESIAVKQQLHVSPVHVVKPLTADETAFRQNLRKKLRTVSIKKSVTKGEVETNSCEEIPRKKRLSLDIESAKQSHCLSEKDSPLVRSDEYLSSTLLPSEPLELETFRDISKPVATQVIQVNPNVLYRESSLRLSSPTIEGPLLPISPHTNSIDYS
uniref:BZIP domain-containing protein n=1 Tax=Cuerna arida TaxID=1464854 RepID=A0A1B6GCG5_9HEMI